MGFKVRKRRVRWTSLNPLCAVRRPRPDHDRLALTELSADRAQTAGQYRVVLPGGEPLPAGTQVTGRGSRLHFLTGTSWYQLDMDDIPA